MENTDLTNYLAPESKGVCSRCGGACIKGLLTCGKCLLTEASTPDDILDANEIG